MLGAKIGVQYSARFSRRTMEGAKIGDCRGSNPNSSDAKFVKAMTTAAHDGGGIAGLEQVKKSRKNEQSIPV
jgi:hypothetical protein